MTCLCGSRMRSSSSSSDHECDGTIFRALRSISRTSWRPLCCHACDSLKLKFGPFKALAVGSFASMIASVMCQPGRTRSASRSSTCCSCASLVITVERSSSLSSSSSSSSSPTPSSHASTSSHTVSLHRL